LQASPSVRRLEADDSLPDRDPGVRRYPGARAYARPGRRGRERAAAADEPALVGERPAELRADAPVPRSAGLDLAQGLECAVAARLFLPVQRAALCAGRGSR